MTDNPISCLDMKSVIAVHNYESAQKHIDEGWYLLNTGFYSDEYDSYPMYILGNTSKITKNKTIIKAEFASKDTD